MRIGNKALTRSELLLLGVDGGGTCCRARLASAQGAKLAEVVAGPANIRLGLDGALRLAGAAAGVPLEGAFSEGRL
jgi:glucosamine kinase